MTALMQPRLFKDAGPGFNHDAAESVYGAIMKCASDAEAAVLSSIYLGEMLSNTMIVHGAEITKALDEHYRDRTVEIGKSLVRSAVETTRNGGDPTATLEAIEALDLISKAGYIDPHARAEHARREKRDLLTGRFVVDSRDIKHLEHERPLHSRDANLLGIPTTPPALTRKQIAEFQRGYREVSDLLEQYSQLKPDEAVVHLKYDTGPEDVFKFPQDGKLKQRITNPKTGAMEIPGIDARRKVVQARLSVLPSTDLSSPYITAHVGNTFGDGGLGMPDTWNPDIAGSFGDEMTRTNPEDAYAPGQRNLRRVGVLARTLNTTLGPLAPPKLKLALATADQAGQLGPQAAKVIGPVADRTAYRYRGTELKTPDSSLTNRIDSIRRSPNLRPGEKREFMIHGSEDDRGEWRPSSVLAYWRTKLPRADLNTLQRKSGTIPPSQGVIINRKGKVTVQAVGYGDDHYLPFNLKNLSGLKGGEYIRTRTFGGPTTEDIYTGLISGAKSLTVVSHNGTYTMEFDDDLKGGRRYNDKAARMVARYGQLLDAVKSQQVTTGGIHPARLRELQAQAGAVYDRDLDSDRFAAELERLKTVEAREPKLSKVQENEAATAFIGELAAGRTTRDGHVMTGEDLVNDIARQRGGLAFARTSAEHGGAAGSVDTWVAREKDMLRDDDPTVAARRVAEAAGAGPQFESYMRSEGERYKSSLTPLSLNSQGYELALTALQEQFPYYIKRVDFHPWDDGTNAFDTGYVKPKHNRPAAALAGYFDPTITGHGKVHADSIRNQNRGVTIGRNEHGLRMVESAQERTTRKEAAKTAAAATAGTTSTAVNTEDAAKLREAADLALLGEIRSKTHFGPHVSGSDAQRAIANKPIEDYLDSITNLKSLHYLMTKPQRDLEEEYRDNPTTFRNKLRSAVTESKQYDLLDLDAGIVRAQREDGLPTQTKDLASRALQSLADPQGTEYRIPGSHFDQDVAHHSPDDIDRAYAADQLIKPLVEQGLLPATPADGAGFKESSDRLRTQLRANDLKLSTWQVRRSRGEAAGTAPFESHVLERQAEGLQRAAQLQRRHQEAMQRATSVQSAVTPSQEMVEVHHHYAEGQQPSLSSRIIDG